MPPQPDQNSLYARLRRRGVVRVAISYSVIGWLVLQIGDVVLDPLAAPAWVMRALIVLVAAGFPAALLLAWYFELGPAGISVDELPEQAERPTFRGLRRHADVVIIAVLLGVIVVLLARQQGMLETPPETPVIAVLPFTEIGDVDQAHLGDGLSDTLIHKLGQAAGVVVLASSSTFEFRGPGLNLAEVGRKLNASAILEGSVQTAGSMLRVNARLVDPASGRQQWTDSFNRQVEDLFAVQDEIAAAVAEALQVALNPREADRIAHRDTDSLSAFEAYQRGRDGIASRSPDELATALQTLQEATRLDPGYALAHAALAEAYFLMATYHGFDTDWSNVALQAHEAAARAQAIDPDLGEAWLAQAFAAMGDNAYLDGAQRWPDEYVDALLKKAIELSPNNAIAWKFSATLDSDPELKLERMRKAAQLDPRSGIVLENLGGLYLDRGELDQARQWYLLSIDTVKPYFELGLASLINSYQGDPNELAMAARWGHLAVLASPDAHGAVWRDYCRTLVELGAWDEAARELAAVDASNDKSGLTRVYRLGLGAQLRRAQGDLATAAESARAFKDALRNVTSRRDALIGFIDAPPAIVLDALALQALFKGDAANALAHYESLFPGLEKLHPGLDGSAGVNSRVLKAAARKQLGDRAGAEAEMRAYLGELEQAPVHGQQGSGFIPFTLHAFLGEPDAALAALRRAADSGFTKGWWGLKDGNFDSDYAAVLADPRCQDLLGKIAAGVAAQRQEFLDNPDPPLEMQIAAGLAGTGHSRS